jgi:predicted homoserine dehydrogenase-like protein
MRSKISITLTRANGKVVKIGVIKGGHWGERLVARIRLWLANRDARRGGK